MNYVFDVDGTLTPSRGLMNPAFKEWFKSFCQLHNVYLVTGSDHAKTVEQVGSDICCAVNAVYNCAGNAVYIKSELMYKSDFKISPALYNYLNTILKNHSYPIRTGQHIEERVGLCNFSIVGRGANPDQRAEYVKYDKLNDDRALIVDLINAHFPEVEATAGGETGVDIYESGKDKSQIAEKLTPFTFFGDAIFPGGNDYTIAQKANKYYKVADWQETFNILKSL